MFLKLLWVIDEYLKLDSLWPWSLKQSSCPSNHYSSTLFQLFLEAISRDIQKAEPEWRIILLRYFNPVGAHESGKLGEDPKGIPNNLMPYIQQVAVGRLHELKVYGHDYPTKDGSAVCVP